MSKHPQISIIIATYNAGTCLEACLRSIISQTSKEYELIIIDGASTDGTVAILENYADQITYWKSEPDSGISAAWNKGLEQARGEWVAFVGADDRYAHPDALNRLHAVAGDSDLAFAKIQYLDSMGQRTRIWGAPWSWRRMLNRQIIAHPGSLHRRKLFECFGNFDEQLRIVGDYDFLLRAGERAKAAFLDDVVLLCGSEGISRMQVDKTLRERRWVQSRCKHIGPVKASFHYYTTRLRFAIKAMLGRASKLYSARAVPTAGHE